MIPDTVRQRLQDYEFTDEQEMTLTLELLNRIEKDVDELKAAKTRSGFSLYVLLGGIATTLYILLSELNKANENLFPKVGVILIFLLLLSKIAWAIYQLIAIDQILKKQHKSGRFFWSNDHFFELRTTGIFQSITFAASIILTFSLPIPQWIMVSTTVSFLLYILIIGLIFIFSVRKKVYKPNTGNKTAMIGLPSIFLVSTFISFIGLISQMEKPIGNETQPYLVAGIVFAIVFLIDTLISLSTPSLLLENLQELRNDLVFLRANLEDAWARYEIYIDGNEITEELRKEMDEIIQCFNSLDSIQSKKAETLSAIQEELNHLETKNKLTENSFTNLNAHRKLYLINQDEIQRVYDYLNPQYIKLSEQIQNITKETQEWQKADKLNDYILFRERKIKEIEDNQLEIAKQIDSKVNELRKRLKNGEES